MKRTAVISECKRFRYRLDREAEAHDSGWDLGGPKVVFLMLNPSTADGKVDDPTIRRCMNFARDWGYGGLTVVNLYAERATEPKALFEDEAWVVRGFDNKKYVLEACVGNDVVLAWGAHRRPDKEGDADLIADVCHLAFRTDCLGLTAGREPRHPLMLRGDALRVKWKMS